MWIGAGVDLRPGIAGMGRELRRTFYRISSLQAPVHGAMILQL